MRAIIFTILAAVVGIQSRAPQGYIVNKSAGKAYKVMYQAQPWMRAKEECENMGASLAVPKSQTEFHFLQRLIRGMYYPQITNSKLKLLVWLGIYNFEDNNIWRNINGEDINETGFSKWASTHFRSVQFGFSYSSDPKDPHCAGMDAVNTGLRHYWCNMRQPYICQIQLTALAPLYSKNPNKALFFHD